MRLAVAVLLLSGCWIYAPDSFSAGGDPFPGKRVVLDCLDVSVSLAEDRRATEPVIAYTFGNHCSHSTIVDLAHVRVIAKYADGTRIPLSAHDPKQEIEPLPIDGWWHGAEEIAYEIASGRPAAICAEVGHIDSGRGQDHWICMSQIDAGGAP